MALELSSALPIFQLSSVNYSRTQYAIECSSPFSIGYHGICCTHLSKVTFLVSGAVEKMFENGTLAYHILTKNSNLKKYLHILIW